MPSRQQDMAKINISQVLFLSVDGEPMSFYLRPGPVKRQLQPLITAGGGLMCNTQQPGAILLLDPADKSSISKANAHRYISTQYIHDCVEKEEQLNVEDYRLYPAAVSNQSAKQNRNSGSSAANPGAGRAAYTSEEDAAIIKFVSKHESEIGGNRIWQMMERRKVTNHSWQSMKYRYRARLMKKQSEVVEEETTDKETEVTEEEIKVEENQETHVGKPSGEEDSAETVVIQIDSQSVPQEEVQQVSKEEEEQPAERPNPETVEVQTSNSPQEELILDSQDDFHLFLPDSTEPGTQQQTVDSTQKESVPEDSLAAHSVSQDASFHKKSRKKQRDTPESEQPEPPRRRTRRQLQLEELFESKPYGKKLRSSSSSASPSSSPQPLRRVKTAFRSAHLKDTTAEQPPSKRARGKDAPAEPESEAVMQESETLEQESEPAEQKSEAVVQESEPAEQKSEAVVQESEPAEQKSEAVVQESEPVVQESETTVPESDPAEQESEAVVQESETMVQESEPAEQEGQQEESGSARVQETAKPEAESVSVPQKGEKKKGKEKLWILKMAGMEFDCSLEDETPDLQNQTVATTVQPAPPDPSSDAACPQSDPESVPSPQVVVPETQAQASTSNCPPETVCKQPEEVAAPAAPRAVSATNNLHLFIFCDSQEEDSQSAVGEDAEVPPKPKETGNKDAPYSLTQAQLEEDKQRITELMKQTNQDLFNVTKALLRTSGDFPAALELLLNPGSISGPFWDSHDDNLLLSADPEVRQQLQEKYGEEALLKRVVFLEVEG
ncbi:telomeric repeat-binding factor 2-interacting protein 1 isoform X1 [Xyrichtys novacula]|uniref:Telomeric repeat-binding factor 2-interacting protein 1 n=1 Tax=Xyrichtys novacula TaxID=13765 RepID=A0AAV1EP53_XYRNO|nr:telomeric repeat-binding factor 2-interacting protein 1 isoform X1 [Xyrichtys novacula]